MFMFTIIWGRLSRNQPGQVRSRRWHWSDELIVTPSRPFSVHAKNEAELDTIGHGLLSLLLFLQCLPCDQSHWQFLFSQSLLGSWSSPGVPSAFVLFVCLNGFPSFMLTLFIHWLIFETVLWSSRRVPNPPASTSKCLGFLVYTTIYTTFLYVLISLGPWWHLNFNCFLL